MTGELERFPFRAGRVTFLVERVARTDAPEDEAFPTDGFGRVLDAGETLPGSVEDYAAHGQADVDDETYRRLAAVLKAGGRHGVDFGAVKTKDFVSPPAAPGGPNVSFVVDHGERLERDGQTVQAVTISRVRLPLAVVRRDGTDVVVAMVGTESVPLKWLNAVRTVTADGFTQDHVFRMPPDELAAVYLVTQAARTRTLPAAADTTAGLSLDHVVVRVPPVGPLLRSMPTNTYAPRGKPAVRVRGTLRERTRSVFDDAGPADTELVVSLDEPSARLAYGTKPSNVQALLPLAAVQCRVADADAAMREILGLFRTDLLVSIDAAMALAVERGGSTTLTPRDLAAVRYGGTTGLNSDQRSRLRQQAEVIQTIGFVWSTRDSKREPLQGKLFTAELTGVKTGKARLFFLASPLRDSVKNGKGHFVPLDLLRLNMKTQEWEYRCGRYLAGRLSENSARLHQASAGGAWRFEVSLDTLMQRAGLRGDYRRDMGAENYRRRLDSMLGVLVNMGLLADAAVTWSEDVTSPSVVVTAGAAFRQAVTGARPRVFGELATRPMLPPTTAGGGAGK